MREVPIADVAQFEIGEAVPAFAGRVLRVQDQNSGTNNFGNWTIQTLDVADENDPNVKVRVKVFDRDEIPKSWINRVVLIQSGQGDKGQIQGVAMAQGYQGRGKCVEVKTNLGAFVDLADGAPAPAQPPQRQNYPNQGGGNRQNQGYAGRNQPANAPQGGRTAQHGGGRQQNAPQGQPAQRPPQQNQTAQRESNTQSRAPKPPETPEQKQARLMAGVADLYKFTARTLSGYKVILRAARKLQDEEAKAGTPLTDAHFQALCATLFIQAKDNGKLLNLPTSDVEKYLPQPKPQPTTDTAQQ